MKRNIIPRLNGFLAFTPFEGYDARRMIIAAKTKLDVITILLDEYNREYLIPWGVQVTEFGKDSVVRIVGLKRDSKQTTYIVRYWIITADSIYKDELVLLFTSIPI